MNKQVNKQTYTFIEYLSYLEPIEIFGLTKILCVKTKDENDAPRTAEQLLGDIIESFDNLGRKQRREILKMLKEVKEFNVTSKD